LSDPGYFALHLEAASAIRKVGQVGWYDSQFLRRFEVAKHFLSSVSPGALETFVDGFEPLRPDPQFRVASIEDVFDETTRARILKVSRSAQSERDEQQEAENRLFGRNVLWDHPFFLELQESVRPRLEGIIGVSLQSSYNFLSLYGSDGKCDPHLDQPVSMYTFDYCIEQSDEWPIYFSRLVDWPTAETISAFDPAALKRNPDLCFESHTLRPNQALLFSGSSQWHYRDPIHAGGFCNLLFFHYFPKGSADLVQPSRWAAHFGIEELEPLCDLFHDDAVDEIA